MDALADDLARTRRLAGRQGIVRMAVYWGGMVPAAWGVYLGITDQLGPNRIDALVHRRIHSLHFEASPKANECVKRCTSNLLILVRFTTRTLDLRACRECESSVCVTALERNPITLHRTRPR
jgi:hypothetical protein